MSDPADEPVLPRRLQRLADELEDDVPAALAGAPDTVAALVELAYALRPHRHEVRVPSYGALLVDNAVAMEDRADELGLTLINAADIDVTYARRFADGVASFAVRPAERITHLACFDRNLADEQDLIHLQTQVGGLIVQRHPRGQVRIFGDAGVVRWDQTHWHHDPPTNAWLQRLGDLEADFSMGALGDLLQFAMHNLAGRGIGATLIWRPEGSDAREELFERLVHYAPRLSVRHTGQQAAIAQAIALTDGAAGFDADGTLTDLGLRLAPTRGAEAAVGALSGTRHTSALRYSFDEPDAILIVVSEAGPVTIMHKGHTITTIDRSDEKIG